MMMRCGLRIGDRLRLSPDCITRDGDGAPYLRYVNHKMRREALVPIDAELERELGEQRQRVRPRWPDGAPVLFPRPTDTPEGRRQSPSKRSGYCLERWQWRRCRRGAAIRSTHDRYAETHEDLRAVWA
ncbi:hypothetical protein [Kribbella capetownensis]|uniref:hypothetical protein n=1 Tax=Kribbella capetownensis TaxID=1572659 RepID=UPI00192DF7BB|nr:hypothetical protein [Kribbella capetownensis]